MAGNQKRIGLYCLNRLLTGLSSTRQTGTEGVKNQYIVQLDLQISTIYMDNRVSDLENHGSRAMNSSDGDDDYDGWLTRLEKTTDQHGQRLSVAEVDIKGEKV